LRLWSDASEFGIRHSALISARWVIAVLLAGTILRIVALPLAGTGDVTIWKVWSFGGAHNVTSMYGVGGSPPNQRVVHWNGEAMTVDYPPIALFELALVGRAFERWDPLYRNSTALNVFIKLPGLLFEIALLALVLTWGRRRYGAAAARWAAVALWLNPALVLNASVLGYLDPLMYVPLTVAVVAASAGAPGIAGACSAIAILTKAQAIFVMPVVVSLVLCGGTRRWRDLGTFAIAAAAIAAVVLTPFIVRGAWPNLVHALSRLAAHDMLSAQAANLWWIVTWLIRVADSIHDWGWYRAVTQEVRILQITAATAAGYPNFRIIGLALVGVATIFAVWLTPRARSLAGAAAIAGWSAYAYAMLAAQVHENHLIPAVPMLAAAAALDRRFRPVFWMVSMVAALNLYLFYGAIPGSPPLINRRTTVVDATVLLSVVNVAAFISLTRLLLRSATPATTR
jgi:hypothetical protein